MLTVKFGMVVWQIASWYLLRVKNNCNEREGFFLLFLDKEFLVLKHKYGRTLLSLLCIPLDSYSGVPDFHL